LHLHPTIEDAELRKRKNKKKHSSRRLAGTAAKEGRVTTRKAVRGEEKNIGTGADLETIQKNGPGLGSGTKGKEKNEEINELLKNEHLVNNEETTAGGKVTWGGTRHVGF